MHYSLFVRIYLAIGIMVIIIFTLLLSILLEAPQATTDMKGWTILGIAAGLITSFVAIELFIRNVDNEAHLKRQLFNLLLIAMAFSVIISLGVLSLLGDPFLEEFVATYSPILFLEVAGIHLLLRFIADRFGNDGVS